MSQMAENKIWESAIQYSARYATGNIKHLNGPSEALSAAYTAGARAVMEWGTCINGDVHAYEVQPQSEEGFPIICLACGECRLVKPDGTDAA